MDREKYMNELYDKLKDELTQDQIDDVLRYYNEYLQDAGIDSYEKICNKLGNPRLLSKIILADQAVRDNEYQNETKIVASPRSSWHSIWKIFVAVCASPVIGLVGILGLCILLACGVVVFSFAFSVVVMLACLFVFGGISIYTGFWLLFSAFSSGLFYLGLGLMVIGVLFFVVPMCYFILAVVLRWIGRSSQVIYRRFQAKRHVER